MKSREELENLTVHIDSKAVECDGASRLVHLALLRAGVEHKVMFGSVSYALNQSIPLHYWIEVGEYTIDYRLHYWLTGNLPKGVFKVKDHPLLCYTGVEASFSIKSCVAVEMVTSATDL